MPFLVTPAPKLPAWFDQREYLCNQWKLPPISAAGEMVGAAERIFQLDLE